MLAGYKIETIVTLNYGGKIIGQWLILFFHNSPMKTADINIILLIILGKTEGFDRNIKLLARFVLLRERGQVHFVYFKSRTRFCAKSSSKNLDVSP